MTIALIGAAVWVAILVVAIAMCRAAAQADALHERRMAEARDIRQTRARERMRAALN